MPREKIPLPTDYCLDEIIKLFNENKNIFITQKRGLLIGFRKGSFWDL